MDSHHFDGAKDGHKGEIVNLPTDALVAAMGCCGGFCS